MTLEMELAPKDSVVFLPENLPSAPENCRRESYVLLVTQRIDRMSALRLSGRPAPSVGSIVTQLARETAAYVIGTGRGADRQTVFDFGAKEFDDLENDVLEDVGGVDLVFDVIGGDIGKRSAGLIRARSCPTERDRPARSGRTTTDEHRHRLDP
jgi:hypothetical protein